MAKTERKLVKKLFLHSEFVAARNWVASNDPDDLDEIWLSYSYEEGGCDWECGIELINLQGKAAARLKVFDDAWKMFEDAPEIGRVLRSFHKTSGEDSRGSWGSLIEALIKEGWKRQIPDPKEIYESPRCHACGKAK